MRRRAVVTLDRADLGACPSVESPFLIAPNGSRIASEALSRPALYQHPTRGKTEDKPNGQGVDKASWLLYISGYYRWEKTACLKQ